MFRYPKAAEADIVSPENVMKLKSGMYKQNVENNVIICIPSAYDMWIVIHIVYTVYIHVSQFALSLLWDVEC